MTALRRKSAKTVLMDQDAPLEARIAALLHRPEPALDAPSFLVPDQMLRDLACHAPERDKGALSPEDQRTLAMVLPDLCGELLAYRRAARIGGDA